MHDIYHVANIASRIPLDDDYVKEAADVWDIVIPGAGLGMTALILSQLLGFDKKTSALLTVLGAVAGAGLGASGITSIFGGKAGGGGGGGGGALGALSAAGAGGGAAGALSPDTIKQIEEALRSLEKGESGYTPFGKGLIGLSAATGAGIGAFPGAVGKAKDLVKAMGVPDFLMRTPGIAKQYIKVLGDIAKRSPEIAKEYARHIGELAKHAPEAAKEYIKRLGDFAKRSPEIAKDYARHLAALAKRSPEIAKDYAKQLGALVKRSPELAKDYAKQLGALVKRVPGAAKGLYQAGVQRAGGGLAALKGLAQSAVKNKKALGRSGARGLVGGLAGYGLGRAVADVFDLRREY